MIFFPREFYFNPPPPPINKKKLLLISKQLQEWYILPASNVLALQNFRKHVLVLQRMLFFLVFHELYILNTICLSFKYLKSLLFKLDLCMCFPEDLLLHEFVGTMEFSADNFNSFNNIKTNQFVQFLVIEPCSVPAYLRPL